MKEVRSPRRVRASTATCRWIWHNSPCSKSSMEDNMSLGLQGEDRLWSLLSVLKKECSTAQCRLSSAFERIKTGVSQASQTNLCHWRLSRWWLIISSSLFPNQMKSFWDYSKSFGALMHVMMCISRLCCSDRNDQFVWGLKTYLWTPEGTLEAR